MKVLLAHVRYRYPGGEDVVFSMEHELLEKAGVEVEALDLASSAVGGLRNSERLQLAVHYADHQLGRRLIRDKILGFRPQVVHFHNLYPLLGPGAIDEARRLGCATVQTLHNFRLSCLNGRHFDFSQGVVCEHCRPTHFVDGVARACYRSSHTQSFLTARGSTHQWRLFLEGSSPTILLALTESARDRYLSHGAPSERIIVKPNSVQGPASCMPGVDAVARQGVFCAGRLSEEKGILPLMHQWPASAETLVVAGDGPLAAEAESLKRDNVRFIGHISRDDVRRQLASARVFVLPSICYEGLPLTLLEALAEGTPVVGFCGGPVQALSEPLDRVVAAPYRDFHALSQVASDIACDRDWLGISERCQAIWRARYSHEANAAALIAAYERALTLADGLKCGTATVAR